MTPSFLAWADSRGAVRDGRTVLHFGDPEGEYHAARDQVVFFDRSGRGRLRLSGADVLDVLHRTTTQDLKGLLAGSGATTVIQTETARILDWLILWVLPSGVLAVTGQDRAAADQEWIEGRVIMDDVAVRDVTAETGLFEVAGPGAAALAATLAGGAPAEPHQHRPFEWKGFTGTVARGRSASPGRFWIFLDTPDPGGAAAALVEAGLARPAGHLASEALRIESGEPLPGRELTTEANPLEAGLRDSISFSKGCYIGQEVIARIVTYKSLKRTLAGFLFDGEPPVPAPGESFPVQPVEAEPGSYPVSRLTSAAFCPGLSRWAGLGFLDLETSRLATPVSVLTSRGPMAARTASLPLGG